MICGLAAIFYAYEFLLRITPSVMIPELMRTFGIPAITVGNLSAYYFYAYSPMQVPVGVMMDRWGPRRIMTLAVFCCTAGTLMFGMTQVLAIAAAGRFLVGFGSAFAFVGVLKLATIWLPPNRLAFISGLTTTLAFLGGAFGSVALSQLVVDVGWNNTVVYSGYFGFILILLMWFMVRDTPTDGSQGASSFQGSFRALMREVGVIITTPQIWINGVVGCLLMLPTTVFGDLWGPQFFANVHGLSTTSSTKANVMLFIGWAVGAPIAGYISDRIRRRKTPLVVGGLGSIICLFSVMYLNNLSETTIGLLLFGVGVFSSVEVICFAIGRENSSLAMAGTAMATTNFLITMGSVIFQPLTGKLLDLGWNGVMLDGIRHYSIETYRMAFVLLPVGLIIALLLTMCLKETHTQQQVP